MLLWTGSLHDHNTKQLEGDSDAASSKREPAFLVLLRKAAISGPRHAREFKEDRTTATDPISGSMPEAVEDEGSQWETDMEFFRRTR